MPPRSNWYYDFGGVCCLYIPLYFFLVANPPRMWRSFLLRSSTTLTLFHSSGSLTLSRSVTSLCTVDLLILKILAAALTVAPVSRIYSPKTFALSVADSLIYSTPRRQFAQDLIDYMRDFSGICFVIVCNCILCVFAKPFIQETLDNQH